MTVYPLFPSFQPKAVGLLRAPNDPLSDFFLPPPVALLAMLITNQPDKKSG